MSARRIQNRGDRSEESRKRYAKKRESILKYQAEYRSRNKEKIAARDAGYHIRNREAKIEKATSHNRENKERHAVHVRNWQAKNPHKLRESSVKRRALKKSATVGDVSLITEWERSWKSKTWVVCFWCRSKVKSQTCHSDHIQPLSKGGAHAVENLCISCGPCNSRKSASGIDKWNTQLSQPILL